VTHKNPKIPTRRLATTFEGLNSSLGQSPGELWSCKLASKRWLHVGFISTNISYVCAEGFKQSGFMPIKCQKHWNLGFCQSLTNFFSYGWKKCQDNSSVMLFRVIKNIKKWKNKQTLISHKYCKVSAKTAWHLYNFDNKPALTLKVLITSGFIYLLCEDWNMRNVDNSNIAWCFTKHLQEVKF